MPVNARPQTIVADQDAYRTADHRMRVNTLTGTTGTITVDPTIQYNRIVNAAGATTVNFSTPNKIYAGITSPTSSYNLPGLSGDTGNIWYVEVKNRGSNTVTFNNVTWDGGVVPTLATTGTSIVGFYSPNGGSTVIGFLYLASL